MVPEDYEQMQAAFPLWKKNHYLKEICLLSPNKKQYQLIKGLFPKSNISVCTVRNWNLSKKNKRKYDLVCAMNIFHYSKQPLLWFNNVLNSCRYFWLQDLIIRYRSEKGMPFQLGNDGDSMRYCFLPEVKSTFKNAFDLSIFAQRIVNFKTYSTQGNPTNLHFILNMKGEVAINEVCQSNGVLAFIYSNYGWLNLSLKDFTYNFNQKLRHALKKFLST